MIPENKCSRCPLSEFRTKIVMPDGNENSNIVLVGEAPGETEDLTGRPFVGRSGKLLEKIMKEEGIERSDVLITNTVKCRPPGNRDPTKEEMDACRPFLEHELSGKRVVVGLGRSACRILIGYEGKMSDIVNKETTITISGKEITFLPSYHPAACIYNSASKEELKRTMRILRERYMGGAEHRPKQRKICDDPIAKDVTDAKNVFTADAAAIDWNDVSGMMIDMDGTVYKGDNVIHGAPEFIERVKKRKIPFVFLTNNSSSDREHYLSKLTKMGFNVSIDNILTSTTATISYLLKHHPGRTVYPIGTQRFVNEIRAKGVRIVEKDPDIVLLAFDTSITYEKINNAYHFIKNGSMFVATHPDDLCPTEHGYDVDIGAFIRFLESMTGVRTTVIGKPNTLMTEMASEIMNVPMKKMVMIGDRLYTDMRMASDAGIRSVMVLTGEARREDISGDIHPTMVVNSVNDLIL
ncbi:MAG: HAD-IIA family hydrolase [Methanomassiliicoccaceae archaeon]|nr:HAD-IIA family hydrolase [Methanomassiliicoccaceae archaeon]